MKAKQKEEARTTATNENAHCVFVLESAFT